MECFNRDFINTSVRHIRSVGLARQPLSRKTGVNRIIVAGGRGFFGSMVIRVLRTEGFSPGVASRRSGADLVFDVEDPSSIRNSIRAGDVIVDATAPFQQRTTTLVKEAISVGADLVDLSDSLSYARQVSTLDDEARRRGVRVLNGCSSVSVLSAFAIEHSAIRDPIAIHGFLAPATRHTANAGAAQSLLASIGQSILIWRGGEMRQTRGWRESRRFGAIQRRGYLMEMADAYVLPRLYPSLENVDFWVNPNTLGAKALFGIVANVPALFPLAIQLIRFGLPLARFLGSDTGVLAYEIENSSGEHSTVVFTGRESYLMAAIPAAMAAIRLSSGDPYPAGIVPVNQHLKMGVLAKALQRYGITIDRQKFRNQSK